MADGTDHAAAIGMRKQDVVAKAFACLFVSLAFFPYPAIPIGVHTGLQLGQLLAVVAAPFMAMNVLRGTHRHEAWYAANRSGTLRSMLALYSVLSAASLAGIAVLLSSSAVLGDLIYKAVGEIALALIVMIGGSWIVTRVGLRWLLGSVATAIGIHACVAMYQLVEFRANRFPLLWLYSNPSFAAVQDVATSLAIPTGRPFGLFPEPSATMASIGAWLVLLTGLLLNPRLRRGYLGSGRGWAIGGAAAGCLLLILSRSGDSLIIASCMALAALGAGQKVLRTTHSAKVAVRLAAEACAVVGVLIATALALIPRLEIEAGASSESWHSRFSSIQAGIGLLGRGPREFLFGVGPGQTSQYILSAHVNRYGTIWSIAVRYIAECGLVGCAALGFVVAMAARSFAKSSEPLLGLTCLLAWLAGVIVTSAYLALSPLWLFLGVMLLWDLIFPRSPSASGGASRSRLLHTFQSQQDPVRGSRGSDH